MEKTFEYKDFESIFTIYKIQNKKRKPLKLLIANESQILDYLQYSNLSTFSNVYIVRSIYYKSEEVIYYPSNYEDLESFTVAILPLKSFKSEMNLQGIEI